MEERITYIVRVADGMGHVKKVAHHLDFDNLDEAINYFKGQMKHIQKHSRIELIADRQLI